VVAQPPDTLLAWILAGAGAATVIVFVVTLQNFFVQPPSLTLLQRAFQNLSIVIGAIHGGALLVLDPVADAWTATGIAMYVTALALFLAAIEAARRVPMTRVFVYSPKCDTILTAGPYRWIRHPIYLSFSLAWLAAPIALHSILLGLSALAMIACYVISANEEERLLAAGPRAAEYAHVTAKTWRMLPYIY
jgi:protein-S-isoprenylcysteine O-methyltransferase Ste14